MTIALPATPLARAAALRYLAFEAKVIPSRERELDAKASFLRLHADKLSRPSRARAEAAEIAAKAADLRARLAEIQALCGAEG